MVSFHKQKDDEIEVYLFLNLVPRVLSYPPYGARDGKERTLGTRLSLSFYENSSRRIPRET